MRARNAIKRRGGRYVGRLHGGFSRPRAVARSQKECELAVECTLVADNGPVRPDSNGPVQPTSTYPRPP